MNHSMIQSSVTLMGLQQKIDLIAHNVANVNTSGFKRKEASFIDILASRAGQPPGFAREGRLTPPGFHYGWGARLGHIRIDFSQGTLKETGNPLDLSIEGNGVFEVEVPVQDADGNITYETRWTRNGAFSLSVNPEEPSELFLVTDNGHYVRGTDDERIRIPAGSKIKVDPDGTVWAQARPDLPAVQVGRLKLLRVLRPQSLEQDGNNLYKLPQGMNIAVEDVLQNVAEEEPGMAPIQVRQGFLEQSNVNLGEEMSELLQAQRAYQLNSQAVRSADTMMNIANNLRGS